jgi:tetratricopeptide (TPR) repeat protein
MNKWTRRLELNRASAETDAGTASSLTHHYFAFLSYSHADSAEADWLHQELERFRVPSTLAGKLTANGVIPKRLTPIFRDRHELAASEDLGAEIRQALELSRCLIVLCSPAAAKSKWTNAEIDTFKRLHPDGCIIAAVIAGEPLASDIPGREHEECFPPALVAKYNRRGKPTGEKSEPLAADLREGKGGKRTGFLKVVAGILSVGLDDLVQRDHLRRQRRMALIAGASLIGMLLAIALALAAIQARDAARDQRREAEGLIEFMVGDLRQKLEPIGRLDVLDGVGSRVLAYYSKQETSELSDAALLQRSRALSLMAKVAFQRGNLGEAQALYAEAMAGTAEAVSRSPDDPELLFQHAQNVFYVGEVARFRGLPAQSEAGYREYKRVADHLAELDADNLKYRMETLYAEENIGISLYDQHRFAEASQQFQRVLGPMEKLASLYPDKLTYQKEFANALAWAADAAASQGDFTGAIASRERELAVLGRLPSGPADTGVQRQLVLTYQPLGMLLAEQGRTDQAIDQLHRAVTAADELTPIEPGNAEWKRRAASARLELAKALIWAGREPEARTATEAACAIIGSLPASDTSSERRSLRTDCFGMRGRLALADGASGPALTYAGKALESVRTELNEDPLRVRYRTAAIYRLIGDANQGAGDAQAATAAWRTGLAQLPGNVAERPREMFERADLLRRLGRVEEARAISAKLAAIGYRNAKQ